MPAPPPVPAAAAPRTARTRAPRRATSLFSAGEAQVWLTGGALTLCVLMILGLLVLVLVQGTGTFWPGPLVEVRTHAGATWLGEVAADDAYVPEESVVAGLPESARDAARAHLARQGGRSERRMLRTGNFDLLGTHFTWVSDFEVARESEPEWAVVVERLSWGRFYGTPKALLVGEPPRRVRRADGSERVLAPRSESFQAVAEGPAAAWARFEALHDEVRERFAQRQDLEKHETGAINLRRENARLAARKAELAVAGERLRARVMRALTEQLALEAWEADRAEHERLTALAAQARARGETVEDPPAFAAARPELVHALPPAEELGDQAGRVRALEAALREAQRAAREAERDFTRVRDRIDLLNAENARYVLLFDTASGQEKRLALDEIVRACTPNRLGLWERLGVYLDRWGEYLSAEPRESNSEGGVMPAIFGTVVMTLIMSLLVVPFGVLAALYLREYAKPGPVVSAVRIAINNLAGVPSIVFGVFGLGFFCYTLGAGIDELLFAEKLPTPTFGTGGILWASFTLALLTLPVVIVATEEALSAVPRSMREGSFACGASKWQTVRRIVLPRAMPGIMTGMILAIARGAGEVAPLMLVGAVKLAPELPLDGTAPFLHPERSFMHLGFHIYDQGFQSQNSEAAKPMVFTATLLLIGIVVLLNVIAIAVRARLRRKFSAGQA